MIRKELENKYLEAMESEDLYMFLQEVIMKRCKFYMSIKEDYIEEVYYTSEDICYYIVFKSVEYKEYFAMDVYKIERY